MKASDQQYKDWCERHNLPEHLSREAFDDATTLYLTQTTELVRKRKLPEMRGNEPFTPQQLSDRMDTICRCNGKYDCDCVSVENQARIELWSEHNMAKRVPAHREHPGLFCV